MGKVRNLEIAQGYLELVQQANTLSSRARENLYSHPDLSLRSYLQLRHLWKQIQDAQPAAEGAAPKLVYMLEQQCKQIYTGVKDELEKDLRQTLEKMKWPTDDPNLMGSLREKWDLQIRLLLELQEPDLIAAFRDKDSLNFSSTVEPVILLPLEVMVQPLVARFRYHFYGEKPTNRLDKPEYFLNHTLDLIDKYGGLMTDLLGPILDERVLKNEVLETIYTDAMSAFITALLPMVIAKCLSFLPQISQQPQLLSHFMHELMAFDTSIRDSCGYVPIPSMLAEWKGVAWKILSTHGYFSQWLSVEKDFALSRYKSIRDAPDSGDVDFDADANQTKPTKGAIRVNDLLETITDRYRSLSSFSQKMKFLLEIQLSIFDDYHNHLHGAFQVYLAASHTAGRLLQGQSEVDAFGLKGLESLAKVFGSAGFLERKMSDWSDDVFFLNLWDELQYRAKANSGVNTSVGDDLKVDDVAAKTSAIIKSGGSDTDADSDGSGLFDKTALAYRRLREQSEEEILRALDVNLRGSLKSFAKYAQWSSLADTPSDIASMSVSPALDGLLETMAVLLGYLARVLAPGPLRRITKHFCTTLQREIYDNVLMHHVFSATGAYQLKRDLSAIESSVEKHTKLRGAVGGSMRRLQEAVFLLSLDAGKSSAGADNEEDDEWNFEDEENAADEQNIADRSAGDDTKSNEFGLWDAEKRIFESNEAARKVLEEMGLYLLGENDARNILKRRVEIGG